jgi:hypothetical protein
LGVLKGRSLLQRLRINRQGRLEILGSIYDLEEDKIYDEEGNLVIPKSYCGQRIVGLADGEYLVTNKFESEFESNVFLPKEFGIYRPFLVEHEWMEVAIFRQISNIVGF